jgi:hypothetical protein
MPTPREKKLYHLLRISKMMNEKFKEILTKEDQTPLDLFKGMEDIEEINSEYNRVSKIEIEMYEDGREDELDTFLKQ